MVFHIFFLQLLDSTCQGFHISEQTHLYSRFVSQNYSSLITISVRKWTYVEPQIYEVQGKKIEIFRSVPENGHSEVLQSQTWKSHEQFPVESGWLWLNLRQWPNPPKYGLTCSYHLDNISSRAFFIGRLGSYWTNPV